jgi:hypothetical protein
MGKWLIVVLSIAWIAWELIAAFDGDPHTWPLSEVITTYLPPWLYRSLAVLVAVWLPWHLWSYARTRSPAPDQPAAVEADAAEGTVHPATGGQRVGSTRVSTLARVASVALAVTGALALGAVLGSSTGNAWILLLVGLVALAVVWAAAK